MASNEDEREHRLRAVWVPTIQPLTSDELNERLASMLELHGETMASYEEKVRAQGLTLQCVGLNHDSSTTVPSSGSSPAISPNSSNEHSSGGATTTTEPDASDCDFVPEMKADIQKQEPIAVDGADAGLAASMRALVVGEEAPKDMEFCPWRMVQKYPDWFIGKTNAPRVSFCPLLAGFLPAHQGEAQTLTSPGPPILRRVPRTPGVGFVRPRHTPL